MTEGRWATLLVRTTQDEAKSTTVTQHHRVSRTTKSAKERGRLNNLLRLERVGAFRYRIPRSPTLHLRRRRVEELIGSGRRHDVALAPAWMGIPAS